MGSTNSLRVYSEKHGECTLQKEYLISDTKTLTRSWPLTKVDDYVPCALNTIDPYIDSAIVIATSYSPSNHSLLVSTYLSNHGKHHNDDYFLKGAIMLPLSSTPVPSQTNLVKVTSVPHSNNIVVYIHNTLFIIDVVTSTLLSHYNSGKTTNLLITKLSLHLNMNVRLQLYNNKLYGTAIRSNTICKEMVSTIQLPVSKCAVCADGYIMNTKGECVISTCLEKFNKNIFDDNQATCTSPATSTMGTFSALVPPSYFQIKLDNELFTTIYSVDVTDKKYSKLTIDNASFDYSYSLQLSPTSKDTLYLTVQLPQNQVITRENTFRFSLILSQHIVTPYFLQNTKYTYRPTKTVLACSDKEY